MIQGMVAALRALVQVPIRCPNAPDLTVEFTIDTGFAGALTLPPAAVAALGLPYVITIDAGMADGSRVRVDVHEAIVVWDGVEQSVAVLALGPQPLLGTALLDGFELTAQFIDGGTVVLARA